ncbi:MAG TPA: DUF222 domain-containing protein [Ilumatobacteraceae bacterium]|nr:DUF222 domain-containing protein [Ilumatobacteraceae bacterium]
MDTDVNGAVDLGSGTEADREWDDHPLLWLQEEICLLAANLTAAEARWLAMVASFDRRAGWADDGAASCVAWLQQRVGLDRSTAYEKVRVATALQQFPAFASAMAAGAVSYAKVRAITRIATDDNADELLEIALERSSHDVERYVAARRRCDESNETAAERAHSERQLTYRCDGPTMIITVRIPVDMGATVIGAVDNHIDEHETAIPLRARRADAVVALAEHATAHHHGDECEGHRPLVTVHLTPNTINRDHDRDHDSASSGDEAAGSEVCCIAPGDGLSAHPAAISAATAARVLCDAVIEGYTHPSDGDSPGGHLGRGRRTVSAKLKRALRLRDQHCQAPGCDRTGWLDAHHIHHWLRGGSTMSSNLVCLCRFHHRMVHEGGWNITGNPNAIGDLVFHRPDGTPVDGTQRLVYGHHHPISNHGCLPNALRPGPSDRLDEHLEAIDANHLIQQRINQLIHTHQAA